MLEASSSAEMKGAEGKEGNREAKVETCASRGLGSFGHSRFLPLSDYGRDCPLSNSRSR
jgi:hypothetical protein